MRNDLHTVACHMTFQGQLALVGLWDVQWHKSLWCSGWSHLAGRGRETRDLAQGSSRDNFWGAGGEAVCRGARELMCPGRAFVLMCGDSCPGKHFSLLASSEHREKYILKTCSSLIWLSPSVRLFSSLLNLCLVYMDSQERRNILVNHCVLHNWASVTCHCDKIHNYSFCASSPL